MFRTHDNFVAASRDTAIPVLNTNSVNRAGATSFSPAAFLRSVKLRCGPYGCYSAAIAESEDAPVGWKLAASTELQFLAGRIMKAGCADENRACIIIAVGQVVSTFQGCSSKAEIRHPQVSTFHPRCRGSKDPGGTSSYLLTATGGLRRLKLHFRCMSTVPSVNGRALRFGRHRLKTFTEYLVGSESVSTCLKTTNNSGSAPNTAD